MLIFRKILRTYLMDGPLGDTEVKVIFVEAYIEAFLWQSLSEDFHEKLDICQCTDLNMKVLSFHFPFTSLLPKYRMCFQEAGNNFSLSS